MLVAQHVGEQPDENAACADPGNRLTRDEGLDPLMRIYVPELDKMKSWKPPLVERVK